MLSLHPMDRCQALLDEDGNMWEPVSTLSSSSSQFIGYYSDAFVHLLTIGNSIKSMVHGTPEQIQLLSKLLQVRYIVKRGQIARN